MKNQIRASGTFLLAIGVHLAALAQQADSLSAEDAGWPRQLEKNGSVLLYYQPQVDEWKDYKDLYGRMAFSLTPKGGQQALGVASIHCGTIVDRQNRTVYLRDLEFTGIRFPSASPDQLKALQQQFMQLIPAGGEPISLDRLMADLNERQNLVPTVSVKNDPPRIFYSASPAILLMIGGEPVTVPIDKLKLDFVVNANWDVFLDEVDNTYYLLADGFWYLAKDPKGTWSYTKSIPKDLSKLPPDQNFDDVKKMVPPPTPQTTPPQVFFSDVPAEMIVLGGAPVYTKIEGTRLLYIDNTENEIFLDDAEKTFYVLLSGRWFRSKSFTGPWEYASAELPTDFANIPADSPKGYLLASVPGTVEAADAVMLAQIPTSAIVNKAEAVAKVKVNYDGEPQFKPIEGTGMFYATNTQEKIIRLGDLYYLCFQAVWFMSTKPNGPWTVCDNVPDEIYNIPPSSPLYNVTYVTQTNATETTVQSNTTAGYFGMFVVGMTVGATVCYGTGWYYPPYYYYGPMYPYPIYRPWPMTYGCGAVYNPWTGGYAMGRSVYGPYGSAHSSAWFNPATGVYGRSASVQGWYGGRSAASAYNPWTGTYAHTQQGYNAYGGWGTTVATRGNEWVQTGHVRTAKGTVAGYQTSGGQSGVIAKGSNGSVVRTDNNVYAGHDGNLYKKNANGGWSQYNNGNWNDMNQTDNLKQNKNKTYQGLERSSDARQRGQVQQQQFGTYQRSGGSMGGGFGGGGMRRR
jgi:hypothetical protein